VTGSRERQKADVRGGGARCRLNDGSPAVLRPAH
jgi:hypothetical protein